MDVHAVAVALAHVHERCCTIWAQHFVSSYQLTLLGGFKLDSTNACICWSDFQCVLKCRAFVSSQVNRNDFLLFRLVRFWRGSGNILFYTCLIVGVFFVWLFISKDVDSYYLFIIIYFAGCLAVSSFQIIVARIFLSCSFSSIYCSEHCIVG